MEGNFADEIIILSCGNCCIVVASNLESKEKSNFVVDSNLES